MNGQLWKKDLENLWVGEADVKSQSVHGIDVIDLKRQKIQERMGSSGRIGGIRADELIRQIDPARDCERGIVLRAIRAAKRRRIGGIPCFEKTEI